MSTKKIVSVITAGAALASCREVSPVQAEVTNGSTPELKAGDLSRLTRDQVQRKLQKLEKAREPKTKMGAMCYSMAMPPDRVEYICPDCGTKTLYATTWRADDEKTDLPTTTIPYLKSELQQCRAQLKRLSRSAGNGEAAFTLDESSFCKPCGGAKDPKLALIVDYASGASVTNAPVSAMDLRILTEFFSGSREHRTSNDGVRPLKGYLKRIEELLGLSDEATLGSDKSTSAAQ